MATERTVKKMGASGTLGTYRVVHFATHGLLASETELEAGGPAEPALVLTPPERASPDDDGLLTSSEILQLKLDADWVILSACNTAGGDRTGADTLSGLARAVIYAGSRALLVSHWAVDNTATVTLVSGVFKSLRGPGTGRGQALRSAVVAMIEGGNEGAHPAYWAPFMVVGEAGPIR
jgi:CHAT domain-containing protein